MKKVAFLLCSDTVGGHELQAIEIFKDSTRYCESTLIINSSKHEDLLKSNGFDYIKPQYPFFKSGNFLFQFFNSIINANYIKNLVKGYDLIIVCAGTLEAGIACGYALYGSNIKLYVPMYVDRVTLWGRIGYLYNFISRLFILPFNTIITINRIQAKFLGHSKNNIIIPNRIRLGPHAISNKNSVVNRKLYFIGRFDKQKRIPELIDWLDSPINKFKHMVIIGEGPELSKINKRICNTHNIKIELYGWMSSEEQNRLISENDILVINSAYEGEPLVIREANNRGSVVIARNIIGHRGCTYRKNRYNNKNELLDLLDLAYYNKLKVYNNESATATNIRRDSSIKQLLG